MGRRHRARNDLLRAVIVFSARPCESGDPVGSGNSRSDSGLRGNERVAFAPILFGLIPS